MCERRKPRTGGGRMGGEAEAETSATAGALVSWLPPRCPQARVGRVTCRGPRVFQFFLTSLYMVFLLFLPTHPPCCAATNTIFQDAVQSTRPQNFLRHMSPHPQNVDWTTLHCSSPFCAVPIHGPSKTPVTFH